MKRILNFSLQLLCAVVLLFLSSCESFLGEDVNKNPTRVAEDQVPLNALLPTVIVNTSDVHYSIAYTTARWCQQTADVGAGGIDSQDPGELSTAWTTIYLNSLQVATRMVNLAGQRNSPVYAGIGKVLQAVNLGLATDCFESIPWTQSLKGSNNLFPDYDSQETIYKEISRLLDEAILDLQKTGSLFTPSTDDLIYGGKTANWIKLANALKARYAIHLTNKGATAAANAAKSALAAAFTANADDFILAYNTRNLNPWNTGVALANNTGNLSFLWSDYFVKLHTNDPRLLLTAQPIKASQTDPTKLVGAVSGVGTVTGQSNANITETTFYATSAAPILMLTFAEMKFIDAEAGFIIGGGSRTSTGTTDVVRNAMIEGVRGHMRRMGIADAEITKYVNTLPASKDLKLSDIMTEKYKALVLNPEVWVDMRRYQHDPNVFRGLVYPQNGNLDAAGKWAQRSNYPSSERSRNVTNVQKYVKTHITPMWRDLN